MLTRLRSRGGAVAGRRPSETEEDNPAQPTGAAAASSRRSVLGDVSNKRQSQKDGGGRKAAKKQTAGAKKEENPSTASASSNGLNEREHAGTRGSARVARETTKVAAAPEGNTRKSTRTRTASSAATGRSTRASSRATTNGNKRSVAEPSGEEETRKSKRVKVGENADDANVVNDVAKTRFRSRVRAQDHRPEKEEIILSDEESAEDDEEVEPRNLSLDFMIPPDFRLERASFDGLNHTDGIAPHDIHDKDNVLQVVPYVTDIFQQFYKAEARSCPEMYMHNQADVNAKMRAILVDWLVEVHMKFRLVPETLYLCINIIDRYCSLVSVARSKLQLVGVTALLIACKYEEIYPPEVRDCVYITDRAYNRQEVLDMEQDMLQRLRFKITVPTAFPFMQRFLNLTKASPLTRYAANYYMERTLQEHDLLRFRPSVVAASSVILALNNRDIRDDPERVCPGMPKILLEYTGFEKDEIFDCAALISTKVGEEPVTASRRQLVAVKRKYDNRKYQHVSVSVKQPSVSDIESSSGGARREVADCV